MIHVNNVKKTTKNDNPFVLSNRKLKKPLQPKLTIQIATPGSKTETPKPVPILAAYICDENDKNLILMHGNYLKPTFEKVVSNEPEEWT